MGLTVHFKLTPPAGTDAYQAMKFVRALYRMAGRFKEKGLVDAVHPPTADEKLVRHIGCDFLKQPVPGRENSSYFLDVFPYGGFLFEVDVGAGCEPLHLGLCKYPATVRFQGKDLPTKNGAGWRLAGFSKTQFASLHGWEHFLRCHCAVVNLLAASRSAGLRVTISDEGEYWPRRSVSKLRANLDHMNGLVAATAGALKDGDDAGENRVESPIFAHKNFERLEAEGAARSAAALKKLKAVWRKL
jgi:hypothetical protein